MALNYKRQIKQVVQNVAWAPGATLQPIPLPTDLPISKILVTLAGAPSITASVTGTLQAPIVPAVCQLLGLLSIQAGARDGSDGIQVKNLPATMAFLDSWLMNEQKPLFTEITPATGNNAVQVTVPIHFLDEHLPVDQQLFTALEAPRYGGANSLSLSIFTGQLQAAAGVPDQTAIVGGTYSVATAGTLVISVSVEQIVPIGWVWPDWSGPLALPMMDRDFEVLVQSGLNNSQSNNIQLNRRGIQSKTIFFQAGQAVTTLAETGYNNLGVTPIPQLVERIGAQDQNRLDGPSLQSNALQKFFSGSAAVWPAGLYIVNDWADNLDFSYSLRTVQGVHSWDLNMGANGGYTQQINRLVHITYNPSTALRAKKPSL